MKIDEANIRVYNILHIYGLLLFNDSGGISAEGLNMIFDLEDIPYIDRQDIINGIMTYVNTYREKSRARE